LKPRQSLQDAPYSPIGRTGVWVIPNALRAAGERAIKLVSNEKYRQCTAFTHPDPSSLKKTHFHRQI
jgi:hypothetical protein